MKKHKHFKVQPLFRREKDVAALLRQKDGLDKIKEFAKLTEKMHDNINSSAKNLLDWQLKACALLPDEYKNNQELITDISELVSKYDNNDKQSEHDA